MEAPTMTTSAPTFARNIDTERPTNSSLNNQQKNDVFSETVERILMDVDAREASRAAISQVFDSSAASTSAQHQNGDLQQQAAGPLTPSEMDQLGRICTAVSTTATPLSAMEALRVTHGSMLDNEPIEKADFGLVDGDSLTLLVPMLEQHVLSASTIDLLREAYDVVVKDNRTVDQWLKSGLGSIRIAITRQGLEAASIMLTIMTSPGVDRRVISDDSIEACIALMRQYLTKNVIPSINGAGYLIHVRANEAGSTTGTRTTKNPDAVPSPPPPKKLKRSTSGLEKQHQTLSREMKKMYKLILSSAGFLSVLLERIEIFVQTIQVDDSPILSLASSALSTFELDASTGNEAIARSLQVSTISLLTAVFRKYPQHRTIVIEDLFPLMLKLPTSKRNIRTYPVRSTTLYVASTSNIPSSIASQNSKQLSPIRTLSIHTSMDQPYIQAISALIVSLIQMCVVMPTIESTVEDRETISNCNELPKLTYGLAECLSVCDFFVAQLLQRCSRKGEDGGASEFRPLLSNMVDDMLQLQLLPEYPAAEMLLLSLCRKLSGDLLRASSANSVRTKGPLAESTYLTTAFDALGKICSCFSRHLVAHREKPLKVSRARYEIAVEASASADSNTITERKEGKAKNNSEVNNCFCRRTGLLDTFMLDCDRCHSWFHGTCVGITRDTIPEVWFCDECQLQLMVMEQTQAFAKGATTKYRKASKFRAPKFTESGGVAEVDETHVFRQLLLNYLSNLSKTTTSISVESAAQFHISKWVNELDYVKNNLTNANASTDDSTFDPGLLSNHFMEQWDPSETYRPFVRTKDNKTNSRPVLSDEGNVRLMLALTAAKSDLSVAFPKLLGVIVKLMADKSVTSLRKLSVKAIAQVIEADPTLMLQPAVRNAVSQRFQDEAISVREAAVSLVGAFVLQTPALANVFHLPLLSRLNDSGVSVRKRTLRIFRDILVSNPSYTGTSVACAVMLQRAADPKEDDNVRDLIHALFQELWLESSKSSVVVANISKLPTNISEKVAKDQSLIGPSLVTPNSSEAELPSRRNNRRNNNGVSNLVLRARVAADQMVSVVQSAGSRDPLASLMKELLFGGEADKNRKVAERRKRQNSAQQHCSYLVEALIEELISLEENRPASKADAGKKLVAIMRTLAVFADATPALVLDHTDPILPYLKADNSVSRDDEESTVSAVCNILSRLSPMMDAGDILRMNEGPVGDDLIRICYNFGSGALCPAVQTLAMLARHEDAEEGGSLQNKLLKLAITFYGYLFKNLDVTNNFSSVSVKVRNNTHRALSIMGSICRHLDSGKDPIPAIETEIVPSELSWSNIPIACYAIFSKYLKKEDVWTRCAALRALGGIFASQPRVMLDAQQTGMVAEVMSENSHPDLQLDALKCWTEILLAEEKRIESGAAKAKLDAKKGVTLSNKISGDQDGDATLVGGVLTKHTPRLFELTTSRLLKVRLGALDLLGNLLRQGLINPMETVPHLLALQGDIKAPAIRALALRLLINEGEKRPDMLRQRVCAGVKRAYYFQRSVYPDNVHVTAVLKRKRDNTIEVECIFSSIFKECIRNSRKQREGLYRSLLGLFDVGEEEENQPKNKSSKLYFQTLPLLSFTAQVLAHLPYNTANDALFIIYSISCNAALHGAQLLDRFATFLRPYGLSSSDEHDDNIAEEDALEKSSKSKNPSSAKGVASMKKANFDFAQFTELCAEGSSLVLLLRLKDFLRKMYNLSETRCLAYIPNGKERGKEICIPDKMSVFNGNVIASADDRDGHIRLYTEFRRVMRSIDEEKMTDSSEEDSDGGKTNQRGQKRKHCDDESE